MTENVTVSVIKADVGSVCGHTRPHPHMLEKCDSILKNATKDGLLMDYYVTHVGDDINLFMIHYNGDNSKDIHELAWNVFYEATNIAKKMHLYGAGQDLLADAFSGNIKGAGPGSAEMTFMERESEPMMFFMADKTEPSAYSLPLSRVFLDPFTTTGLVIDPKAKKGFNIEIHDIIGHKRVVMSAPEETLDILSILGDTSRYAIKKVSSRAGLGPVAIVSTDKLNLMAGKYVGKDDPVCVVRAQNGMPSVGEYLQPFMSTMLVSGWMRGSHYGALYPCSPELSTPTYFDGPPRICCLGFQIVNGHFQGLESSNVEIGTHIPVDYFAGPEWDYARQNAIRVSKFIRTHGPFMPAILGPEEMEYTSKPKVLENLIKRFENLE